MFTVVPNGTLLALTVNVTGASIGAGNVMSGTLGDAAGLAGISVPPSERIRSTGWLDGTDAVGKLRNDPPDAPVMVPENVFETASIRICPPTAAGGTLLGRLPPLTLIVPVPVNSCATIRMLPPPPPPPKRPQVVPVLRPPSPP